MNLEEKKRDLSVLLQQGREALERLKAIEILAGKNREEIHRLAKHILGYNGVKGLIYRVQDLEKFVETYEKDMQMKNKDHRQLRYTLYGIILTLLLNFFWNVFVEKTIENQSIVNKKIELLLNKIDKIQDKVNE